MDQTSSEKQVAKTKHVRIRFPESAHSEILSGLKAFRKRIGVKCSFNSYVVAAVVEKAKADKAKRTEV